MKIITLCGSLKFQKEMMTVAEKMALEGYSCTSIFCIRENRDNQRAINKDERSPF